MQGKTYALLVAFLCITAFALAFATPSVPALPVAGAEAPAIQYVGIVNVVACHADGTVFFNETNHNLITNIGKDFVKTQIADNPNTGNKAIYIALSTNSSTPAATWTILPNEINSGGLARATGTYTSTGTGQWTVSKTFTATSSFTGVQLAGLHWSATSGSDNNLFAANTFSSVNLISGDQLTVTWTITVTDSDGV